MVAKAEGKKPYQPNTDKRLPVVVDQQQKAFFFSFFFFYFSILNCISNEMRLFTKFHIVCIKFVVDAAG
jgi:hypothetical protein